MAQRTIVELLDDLDGESEAAETVSFGLDGQAYEIDLTEEHAQDLRGRILEFSQHARKVGGRAASVPRPRSSTPPDSALKESAHAVREWARAAGYEVNGRGRISRAIRDAYRAAKG
jgi:hypothetical protein